MGGEEESVLDDTSLSLAITLFFMIKEPENLQLWSETQKLMSEKGICKVQGG